MFGPKKHKVSKEDLKKSVINANTKLVSANKRLEGDINAKEERLKALGKEYDKCKINNIRFCSWGLLVCCYFFISLGYDK